MSALIFDTETTGGDPPKMIEAAGIVLEGDEIDLRPASLFCDRYNPGVPSTLGALATHHILDEELKDCPLPDEFSLDADVEYLIGHNVDYDWKVIGEPDVKRICTFALSRYLFPTLDSHTLGAMAYFFLKGEARNLLRNAHSAASDCETTRHVLRYLIGTLKKQVSIFSWEDLWAASEVARVPVVMAFGKHKGTKIADLPPDYVDWMLRQNDVDPYLRKALTGG